MNWCNICGHAWHNHKPKRSERCPGCSSTNWDGSKTLRRVYDFGDLLIGETKVYEWHKNINKNHLILKALLSYSYRTKHKFKHEAIAKGLKVTRIS